MYNIVADYHTHTLFSHGKGNIFQNVEAAFKKGLKKIAITDHGFGHLFYGVTEDELKRMRREVDGLNDTFEDIEVLLGIEANLIGLDGTVDIPEEHLESFDIILMGFHNGAFSKSVQEIWNLLGRNIIAKAMPSKRDAIRYDNTMAMIKAMERYPIDIITHPGAKIDIDPRLLAKHAAKHDVALEINASHGHMTVEYVKIAMEEGASFVISSDAHTPEQIGNFERAIAIAREAGLDPASIINSSEYLSNTKKGG